MESALGLHHMNNMTFLCGCVKVLGLESSNQNSTQGSHLPGKWCGSKRRSREEADLEPEIPQEGTSQWGPPQKAGTCTLQEVIICHQHYQKSNKEQIIIIQRRQRVLSFPAIPSPSSRKKTEEE